MSIQYAHRLVMQEQALQLQNLMWIVKIDRLNRLSEDDFNERKGLLLASSWPLLLHKWPGIFGMLDH